AAARADDLGAPHEQAVVGSGLDLVVGDRVPEARPAGAGVELGVGAEELLTAARAAVHAVAVLVPICAREGLLGALVAEHLVLLGRQLLAPVGFRLLNLLHLTSSSVGFIAPSSA